MVYVTHDQVEAMTMGDRIVVLKDGHIQQIDEPLNLYNNPANIFVAGFIGSPAMNFIEGRIVKQDGIRFLEQDAEGRTGELSIPLGDGYASTLAGYIDRGVTMGIRPEALFVSGTIAPEKTALPIRVNLDVLEPMGNEIIVYANTESHRLIARVAPQQLPEPGAKIDLVMDTGKLHFFDRESGTSIC